MLSLPIRMLNRSVTFALTSKGGLGVNLLDKPLGNSEIDKLHLRTFVTTRENIGSV